MNSLHDVVVERDVVSIGDKTYPFLDILGVRSYTKGVEVVLCEKPGVGCMGGSGERRLRSEKVAVEDPSAVASEVRAAVKAATPNAPNRVLVFVNPSSGTGRASKVYQRSVKPVLRAAGIEIDLVVTSRENEAFEKCAGGFDDPPGGILVVGGDGTLSEVVRGLVARDADLLAIPLGHAPGGTGNACAQSIAHQCGDACSGVDAAYYVAKGTTRPLDLLRVELADGSVVPSFLSIEWAIIADIDLGSDSLRCLGDARFTLAAIYRLLCLRKYCGTLSYLPEEEEEEVSREKTPDSTSFCSTRLPPLAEPLPDSWVQVEATTFQLAMALNLSHIDATTLLAPRARLDDGAIHLVWTAEGTGCCAALNLADTMIKFEDGTHIDKTSVNTIKCRAFRLVPSRADTSRLAIDGEEFRGPSASSPRHNITTAP
ncbi:hypothetical protein CTAYLR_001885 [Chrysophaeum taylorii]|uniref:DAGKc domain-containing protein n=1 Tax=Chrysophaeum taylorii TaxID=2483200 RepID=A0AAD7U872_9STRA|nr:hypothetical protein CTAYLR_001885 [Chrysophaeum taylorii]